MREAGFNADAIPHAHEVVRLKLHRHLQQEQLVALSHQEDVLEDCCKRSRLVCFSQSVCRTVSPLQELRARALALYHIVVRRIDFDAGAALGDNA